MIVESAGASEISIRKPSWDPETAPQLWFAIEDLGIAAAEIPVVLDFKADDWIGEGRAKVQLSAVPGAVNRVDLRQSYAFSLSERVSDLRVVLTKPGRYRVRLAEITPDHETKSE